MRSRRAAAVPATILLLAASAMPEEPAAPSPPRPEGAVAAALAADGFAVDPSSRTTLYAAYRSPPEGPVFLSADAGLALFALLVRRAADGATLLLADDIAAHLPSWDEALRAAAPDRVPAPARFHLEVLRRLLLVEGEDGDPHLRSAAAAVAERGETGRAVERELLGRGPDPALLLALERGDTPEGAPREAAAVAWLLRAPLPRTEAGIASRELLVRTLPAAVRDRLLGLAAWLGTAVVRSPGAEGLFSIDPPRRSVFPPGTALARPGAVALQEGVRLGSPDAARLLAADGGPLPGPPPGAHDLPDSVDAGFDVLLRRSVQVRDPGAPALFRSAAWEERSLSAALAARALVHRAAGSLHAPMRVYGGNRPRLLVHPEPEFWEELAALARRAAAGLESLLPGRPVPPAARRDEAVAALDALLARREPLAARHLATLRRMFVDEYTLSSLVRLGSDDAAGIPLDPREERGIRNLRQVLVKSSARPAGAPLTDAESRGSVRQLLGELARVAAAAASCARAQGEGGDMAGFEGIALEFGGIAEWVEPRGGEPVPSPHVACAAALVDGPRRVVHGSSGLHDLWIDYPWEGGTVRARGVALGFREWTGASTPGDAAWARLVASGEAAPPSWTGSAGRGAPRTFRAVLVRVEGSGTGGIAEYRIVDASPGFRWRRTECLGEYRGDGVGGAKDYVRPVAGPSREEVERERPGEPRRTGREVTMPDGRVAVEFDARR